MLKFHKTSDMFRSLYDYPQGVCQYSVLSTRHNGKGHTPTGKHRHNLIPPNACFHISYMVYVLWYIV